MVKETTVAAIVRADKDKILALQRTILGMEKELHRKQQRIEELEAQNRRIVTLLETLPTEVLL